MARRANGGLIGVPNTPTTSIASGVWSLFEQSRWNKANAWPAFSTVPGAPTSVSAVAGNAQAIVSFSAPASTGGSPITSYTVTSSPGGITATGSASPITITGLTNGTAYTFTVTATNVVGTGTASSASNSVTPTAVVADSYFNLVSLLLSGNGTNGAQNNTFLDTSSNNFTITRNGNTTQGTFSPFSQTGWSAFFSGSTDNINFASNAAFGYGTGDFTIEGWVYSTNRSVANTFFAHGGDTLNLYIKATTGIIGLYTGGVNDSTTALPLNQWNHVAVSRSGTTLRVYLNGTSILSLTNSTSFAANTFFIGRNGTAGSEYMNGYISNVRVVKGTAVYSGASATVPTSDLTAITNTQLLTLQSNRFIDNSSNVLAMTIAGSTAIQAFSPFAPTAAYSAATNGGSGYFDGTGDYLNYSGVSPGTGAFTLECWFYNTGNFSGNKYLFGSATTSGTLGLRIASATSVESIRYNVATTAFTVPTMALNSWNHIVLVRDGSGNETVFLNGVRSSSGVQTDTYNYGATSVIGALNGTDGLYFTGYISGVRIATSALYSPSSTTITVPTAPPSATGTALCLNFTNGGIFDATSKNVLETVGNAQISTTQSKFGGASIYLDGSGDLVKIPNRDLFNLRSSDFTIELWFYPVTLSSQNCHIVDFGDGLTSGQNSFNVGFFGTGNTNFPCFIYTTDGTNETKVQSSTSMSTGQWYHFAVVRSGTTLTLYLNGSSVATATLSGSLATSTQPLRIGSNTGEAGGFINGYIDDLRITRYARYSGSSFTVPAAALPVQ